VKLSQEEQERLGDEMKAEFKRILKKIEEESKIYDEASEKRALEKRDALRSAIQIEEEKPSLLLVARDIVLVSLAGSFCVILIFMIVYGIIGLIK